MISVWLRIIQEFGLSIFGLTGTHMYKDPWNVPCVSKRTNPDDSTQKTFSTAFLKPCVEFVHKRFIFQPFNFMARSQHISRAITQRI